MFHAIVCSKCEVEFRCFKNGVELVDYASNGSNYDPDRIWEADEWECPGCGAKVITGFAIRPYLINEEGFTQIIEEAKAADRFRASRPTLKAAGYTDDSHSEAR